MGKINCSEDNENRVPISQKTFESTRNWHNIKECNRVKNKRVKHKTREQSGHFHVYFRGNSRQTVFYTDDDFIEFLIKCNIVSKQYNTKIAAFVIMDNHVHMHLITDELTPFMRALLISFTRWYNKRKGMSDKLFKSPFSSARIYSKALIADNLLYIFSNPIKAGICQNPWEYKWSSYHFHNNSRRNPLPKFINIDTSIVNEIFPNKSVLDSAICDFASDSIISNSTNFPKTPDNQVIQHMNTILNGQNLFTLTKNELKTLMVRLRKEKGATFRQIASLTHESYEEVRKLFWQNI